ncbi:hypothetical protein [Legionella impletisoli]|uniref:Secreted protein n=1 Tax=Legionella impletisoli TaxID=343510 RepID=A0A917NCA0_9GAMM|nr:hypothetical protein [Legionella impletisoli]GGI88341.1 hypothetical protein GCM10007966_16400 [Legionella impletisoli]
MKALILSLVSCSFFIASFSASADSLITITGEPISIHQEGDVYVPATTVVAEKDYYYFTVDGAKRVCYHEVQPNLADLTVHPFQVRLGGDVVTLQCYDYSPQYFVVH